ncbi:MULTISPECIES: urease accessory protein UreF [Streptomyces]|jgi:urease accessory protein|uniref:urease accessory protein UreF n=1 Tax=Streptomyces TaxID=1883 RepID=UPI0019030D47|nr:MULTISPECIES: urease accessory UreF family protein [unclassified Streptomyces]MCU4748749.1 urease accessory protein UreF [Streptomyces sp. G-5]QQN80208.1 urease accessory protein UreF [Streptomyces sp. XC 2026]
MPAAALLLLADGRFPAGSHAHSGGAEAAVRSGHLTGPEDLAGFCHGRLHTTGLVAAALAAAGAAGHDPGELDAAADARTPAPALRVAARRLGRQLLRAARATWPDPALDAVARRHPGGLHQPVVLGLAARAAGLTPYDAAQAAAYESVSGPATAVVRLLGLDPFDATALLARLGPGIDAVATRAVRAALALPAHGTDALPAASAPLLDIAAQQHAVRTGRLFAS